MDCYLKVFNKVLDKVIGVCIVFFQKLMKVTFKNLYPVVALHIINSSFYLLKTFIIVPFLVILHKYATSTVTFIKHTYFKRLGEQLTTNH